MTATSGSRRFCWMVSLIGMFWLLPLVGCGTRDYEAALEESVDNRREQLRLMEQLKRDAEENPDTAPGLDYANMTKEELEQEGLRRLQQYEEMAKQNEAGVSPQQAEVEGSTSDDASDGDEEEPAATEDESS